MKEGEHQDPYLFDDILVALELSMAIADFRITDFAKFFAGKIRKLDAFQLPAIIANILSIKREDHRLERPLRVASK